MLPEGAWAAQVDGDDAALSIVDYTIASPREMNTDPEGASVCGYDPQGGEDLADYLRRL